MQLQSLKMKTEPPENAGDEQFCGSPYSSRIYPWSAYTEAYMYVYAYMSKKWGEAEAG